MFECATALISEQASEAFLGTQGDPWDTQEDLFACLIGAFTAVQLTRMIQDRSIGNRASTRAV